MAASCSRVCGPVDRSAPAPRLSSLVGDVSKSATFATGRSSSAAIPTTAIVPTREPDRDLARHSRADLGARRWPHITSLTGYTDNTGQFNEDSIGPISCSKRTRRTRPIPAERQFRHAGGFPQPVRLAAAVPAVLRPVAEFDTRTDIKQFNQELRLRIRTDKVHVLLDGLYWHEKSVYRDSSLFWLRQGGNQILAQFISASQGATPVNGTLRAELLPPAQPAGDFGQPAADHPHDQQLVARGKPRIRSDRAVHRGGRGPRDP